jgi:hypothetical protein
VALEAPESSRRKQFRKHWKAVDASRFGSTGKQ